MRMSKVSVVVGMPVYNAEEWLESSIKSWLSQTRSDFRLVISDNASSDASYEICEQFARCDPRIVVSRNPRNIGIYANFRRVFELGSDSDYFMWASSHDYFSPVTLERCVSTLEAREDAVLCCGGVKLFERDLENSVDYEEPVRADSDSPVERFRAVVTTLRRNNFIHGVIRTSALKRSRLVEDTTYGDKVLVAHLALMGKFVQLPDTLFYRRQDRGATTTKMDDLEISQHWDPLDRGTWKYNHWKTCRGLVRAVLDTALSPTQRFAALVLALKCWYWERKRLAAELAEGLRTSLPRPGRTHG